MISDSFVNECKHKEYCDLSISLCKETDFQSHCLMKDCDIGCLPLLQKVKDRKEKDKVTQYTKE